MPKEQSLGLMQKPNRRTGAPAPDIFLEAARRIGVKPKFCRAYEDTDLGLQALRSAGMEAVDVRKLLAKHEREIRERELNISGTRILGSVSHPKL